MVDPQGEMVSSTIVLASVPIPVVGALRVPRAFMALTGRPGLCAMPHALPHTCHPEPGAAVGEYEDSALLPE